MYYVVMCKIYIDQVAFSCTITIVACVEANTHFVAEIGGVEGMKPLHLSRSKIILIENTRVYTIMSCLVREIRK